MAIERLKLGMSRLVLLMSLQLVFTSALSASIPGVNINNLSGKVKILVKPNSKKTEILGWDEERKAFRVAVAAPAEDNKANIAVIKFFSKLTGKRVRILTGLKSKEKILLVE